MTTTVPEDRPPIISPEDIARLRAGEPVIFRWALSDAEIEQVAAAIWAHPRPDLPEWPT